MSDIDDRIRGALDDDDRAFLARMEDQRGLFRQIGDSLAGPLGGWAKLVATMSVVLGLALLFAAWRTLTAGGLRETVLWATATVVLVVASGFLKDWLFNRMNMLTLLRELKRLQVLAAERD